MSTNPIEISLTPYCEMTISGIIAPDSREPSKLIITTPAGSRFRAAPLGEISLTGSELEGQWRVIPITQTDGVITKLQIIDRVPTADIVPDQLICIARAAQVNRKHTAVALKIDSLGGQTLRPTLLNPPTQVKQGQLWHFVAHLVGDALSIVTATLVNETGEAPTLSNTKVTQALPRAAKTDPNSPTTAKLPRNLDREYFRANQPEMTATALAAMNQEVPDRDWEISLVRVKEPAWEWEAQSLTPTELRGRVQVNSRSKAAKVHLYPRQAKYIPASQLEISQTDPQHLDRLIVTPLGAARGIGASCFRVQIGPYELVMDAGTRPKGSDP